MDSRTCQSWSSKANQPYEPFRTTSESLKAWPYEPLRTPLKSKPLKIGIIRMLRGFHSCKLGPLKHWLHLKHMIDYHAKNNESQITCFIYMINLMAGHSLVEKFGHISSYMIGINSHRHHHYPSNLVSFIWGISIIHQALLQKYEGLMLSWILWYSSQYQT